MASQVHPAIACNALDEAVDFSGSLLALLPDSCDGMQVKLQGIPGIRKVFMRELKTTHLDDNGIYQTENQWVLDTEGVNLLDVSLCTSPTAIMTLSHKA